MTKDEALKLALEALENSVDLVSNEARAAEKMYANVPTRLARVQGLVAYEVAHEQAIAAVKEALAQPPLPESAKLIECERIMREIASWLGCGGYNADEFIPSEFEAKIRYGIEHLHPPAAQPEERYFCQLHWRCGKPVNLTTIHTCTPPRENT